MASPPGPGGPPVSYDPPPNELGYYEGLFTAADIAKTGSIGGRDTVAFLSRSKLSVDILKNIWNMSDANPKTNSLDRRKFFIAVRFIQLYQNGKSAQGPDLSCDPTAILRPPFFEGVTGVTIQPFAPAPMAPSPPRNDGGNAGMQQHQQQTQQSIPSPPPPHMQQSPPRPGAPGQQTTTLTQDPYLMLPGEQVRYESLFPQYEKDGFVYGKEAVELFTKSGLGKDLLRDIWNLVDDPVDNRLSKLEFAIAMHLIVCISKKNLPMPPSIPPSLSALKDKENGGSGVGGVGAMQQQPQPPLSPGQMNGSMTGMPPVAAMSPPRNEPQMAQMGMGGVGGPPPIPSMMQQRSFSSGAGNPPGVMPGVGLGVGGGMGMMNISDAFAGMQSDGPPAAAPPALKAPELPPTNTIMPSMNGDPPTNQPSASASSPSSNEELSKVQSVLQKLQAENISLKAQLGQYSEEEKRTRDEIARTVAEIGTLSQELTSLRSQVVDAKSSLIEASAELKAQTEKRDSLRNLVGETIAMRDTIKAGIDAIQGAEASVRDSNSRAATGSQQYQPPVQPNPFSYDGQQSVNSGFGGDGSSYYGVGGGSLPPRHPQQQPAVAQPYYEPPSVPGVPPTPYGEPQQQLQSQQTGPSDEVMRNLEGMKAEAENAENEAMSAADHVQALRMRYEDLRTEARQAEMTAAEKQNAKSKRKGLLGGKKKGKKEVEAAKQLANEKNALVQQKYNELQMAEQKVGQLKNNAALLRSQAESYEIQIAEELTSVAPPHATPAPGQVPMSQQQFGAMVNDQYMASPHHARTDPHAYGRDSGYGTSYGAPTSSYVNPEPTPSSYVNPEPIPSPYVNPEPTSMGFGGYAGNPAEMTNPNEPAPMGGAPAPTLMGGMPSTGNFTDNSSAYGTASNNGGSIVYNQGGYTSDAPSKSSAVGLMGGSAAVPTDSSIVGGMSTGGSIGTYSLNYAGYASDVGGQNAGYTSDVGGQNAGYTSDVGAQSLVSSKESNPNLAPSDPSGYGAISSNHESNPELTSNDLLNAAPAPGLSVVSSKESFMNPGTGGDASDAGISYADTLNTTGISIAGESNAAPDASAGVNNNSDAAAVAQTLNNPAPISEYSSDAMPKANSRIPPYSYSDAAKQGIIEGQEADYSQTLGTVMSNDTNGASVDAFEGIPSPDKDGAVTSSQLPTNGFTEPTMMQNAPATQLGGNIDSGNNNEAIAAAAAGSPSLEPLQVPVTDGKIEDTMNMMGNLDINASAFDGIPSPDKMDDQQQHHQQQDFNNIHNGQPSGEQLEPSASNDNNAWDDGIPSPTQSYDEYANPFAPQKN